MHRVSAKQTVQVRNGRFWRYLCIHTLRRLRQLRGHTQKSRRTKYKLARVRRNVHKPVSFPLFYNLHVTNYHSFIITTPGYMNSRLNCYTVSWKSCEQPTKQTKNYTAKNYAAISKRIQLSDSVWTLVDLVWTIGPIRDNKTGNMPTKLLVNLLRNAKH